MMEQSDKKSEKGISTESTEEMSGLRQRKRETDENSMSEEDEEDHKLLNYDRNLKKKDRKTRSDLNQLDAGDREDKREKIKDDEFSTLDRGSYWLTRIVILRYIGFIYC